MTPIHVVAGALFNERCEVLIAQRPPGKHMAGGWEFPGGKVGQGETPLAALTRELREELSVEVLQAEPMIAYTHEYADRIVLLDLWRVRRYRNEPISAEGQALKWIAIGDLESAGLLEADRPMIAALRLQAG